MATERHQKDTPLLCSVVTELQAAQVTKLCEDHGIKAIIRIKPFVEISQLKKALKEKFRDKLYLPCQCGSEKKFKFCCYPDAINIEL